jgi:hypothetical protein
MYFGIQGIDELVEFAHVFTGVNKGGLGLLFQLNDLIGLSLTFYITWFVGNFDVINPDSSP